MQPLGEWTGFLSSVLFFRSFRADADGIEGRRYRLAVVEEDCDGLRALALDREGQYTFG